MFPSESMTYESEEPSVLGDCYSHKTHIAKTSMRSRTVVIHIGEVEREVTHDMTCYVNRRSMLRYKKITGRASGEEKSVDFTELVHSMSSLVFVVHKT